MKKGLVFNPYLLMCKIACFLDADYAGIYGHENPTDTSCVKIRTIFIITFSYGNVLWESKLQTETTLLTMEADIVALEHCCK